MKKNECLRLKGFYENELINRILAFWLPRCEDREYGGFVNCFDNEGKQLISYDKYTWSQGRFVWMFSRLATIKAPIFSQSQRNEFLRLAESGKQFLMRHCLMTGEELAFPVLEKGVVAFLGLLVKRFAMGHVFILLVLRMDGQSQSSGLLNPSPKTSSLGEIMMRALGSME